MTVLGNNVSHKRKFNEIGEVNEFAIKYKKFKASKPYLNYFIENKGIKSLSSKKTELKNSDKFFDKILVLEVYSSFMEDNINQEVMNNEIVGNFESGTNLSAQFHPSIRFIWSVNKDYTKNILKYSSSNNFCQKTINLAEEGLEDLNMELGDKSKLIIVGQGNLDNHEIADLDSDLFIGSILEDLNITNLGEIELFVCKLGRDKEYINDISEYFNKNQSKTNIITYTDLITFSKAREILAFNDDGERIDLNIARVVTFPFLS